MPGAVLIKRLVALEGDWLYVPGRADVQKIPKARHNQHHLSERLSGPKFFQRTRQLMVLSSSASPERQWAAPRFMGDCA